MRSLRRPLWKVPSLALLIFSVILLLPLSVDATAPQPLEQRSATPTPTSTPGPVAALEDVQRAVVRIEAVGAFRDPAAGMQAGAGSGSGFIIDPEGHVVTNHHVVTGAALLRVYVDGRTEPVSARVLGVAECADLAVIKLQGSGYPYLTWYENPIRVGLDVYAAGFPLGDPEFTLTRGIVAKARADGRRSWASVENVIEHDANINPGNSGGPLVTADGKVVGVNYSVSRGIDQFHAIGRDGALEIIDQLLAGIDVDSIGVNGEAIISDDGALYGVWVASVASGSLADEAGLLPGDIILSMENLPVGEDGTLGTYCDILRSRRINAVTNLEVLRLDSDEILTGQLNGRPLQRVVSLGASEPPAQAVAQPGATPPAGAESSPTAPETYDTFVTVADQQGVLRFSAPAAWEDVQDGDWVFAEETVGLRLDISPDLDNFYDDWGLPGAILRYSALLPDQMAAEELLDEYTLNTSCTKGERDTITVGDLAGAYQFWNNCGGGATSGVIVALAEAETNAFYVLLELYGVEERDFNAWDTLLNSLLVTPLAAASDDAQAVPTVVVSDDSPLFALVDTSDLIYTYVAVEHAAISALLPADYGEITAEEWKNSRGEPLGFALTAAPDIESFNTTWRTPGIIVKSAVGMGEELALEGLLESEWLQEDCTYDDRYTYTHDAFDRTYNIVFDVYEQCGNANASYAVLVAQSDPVDQVIFVDFQAVDDADIEAFNTFLDSFYLDAALASGLSAAAATEEGDVADSGPPLATVSDETETISLRVPASWQDLLSKPWDLGDGPVGISFKVAPDLQEFDDTWETPGIFVAVSEELAAGVDGPEEVLDFFDLGDDCVYDNRYEYATQTLAGAYDVWAECGGVADALFVILAATPNDADSPLVLLYTKLPTPADQQLFGGLVDSLTIAGAVQSAQTAAQAATTSAPDAVVIVDRLNVRSGPGTNYNRVGTTTNGEALVVTGQSGNCSWLLVETPTGVAGWVSGSSQYVTLNIPCAEIPAASAPPVPSSSGAGQTGGSTGQTGGSQNTGASATQGCYTFQNFVGPELTLTFTNRATGRSETFRVAGSGELLKCFDPGRYTYTVDAPPPWGSFDDELTVEAGDRFLFPIRPE